MKHQSLRVVLLDYLLSFTILALDRDAAALRIDSYHAGGVLIQSPRASIVAGEMNPVSGALLLHDL